MAKDFHDTNYIFLSFVTHYLPVGVVGLIVAVIFTAAMSSTSGEINSLAAVTVIDLYQRHVRKDASDQSLFDCFAHGHGILGCVRGHLRTIREKFRRADRSGEYRWVAFLRWPARSIRAGVRLQESRRRDGAFFGVLAGEAAIFSAFLFTKISFLWYNVIGMRRGHCSGRAGFDGGWTTRGPSGVIY